MMRLRILLPSSMLWISLVLLAAILASCAPATSAVPPVQPVQPVTVEASATFVPATSTLDTSAQAIAGPPESLSATPFPVATSRGPNLEATDPTTVSMASGGLQFVEFFEFW